MFILKVEHLSDGYASVGWQLQASGGFTQDAAKQVLRQGYSSCLVVPLLVASLDPVMMGLKGTSGSPPSLRDYIELDCRGKLSSQSDGRYLLEFSEIKSSLEG